MGLAALAGHNDHVDILILDQFEDLFNGITDTDVANVKRAGV